MLKSNGLHRPKIRLKKFSFSLKTVPAYISKKLPSQCWPKPLFIAFFNFSHKWPTFAFTSENGYTLGFRRKIAHKGTHGETRGTFLPRPQHGPELPVELPPKEQPEEADARLRRVSAFFGVAAPLGCVILSLVFQHCVLLLSMWNSHTTQTDWYHHSRLVLHAVEPPTSGHQNGPLIVYCSVWQILY